jgi:adenosylmethionine-8-amino-7-oxononanoate aminotransferase
MPLSREAIVALDKRHVWHPYTPMQRYVETTNPFVITGARGAHLFDADGRRYLDGNASWWVSVLGYGHPRLVRALQEQAASLCHVALAGVTHEPAARLAEALVGRAPAGLSRVFFGDDGSTALEAAIKMALGYHRNRGNPSKTRFVALDDAFHGETLGVTALGGVNVFRQAYVGVLMDVIHTPVPSRDPEGVARALAALEALFAEHHATIAGLVVEPIVQGASGMRIYPADYLAGARALCDRFDVLLVADEVFTGYGRTGPFWAVEHARITPDLLCSAKGLSGGMLPMAATLTTDAVYEAFLGPPENALWYGHSFTGNPLGARVALEVLDVYRDEGVLEGVPERAERIAAAFERMGRIPGAANPRAIGCLGAIDLAGEGAGYLGEAGWRAHARARELGAFLRPLGDVVYVTPALNIALDELDELLAIVEASVAYALG